MGISYVRDVLRSTHRFGVVVLDIPKLVCLVVSQLKDTYIYLKDT